MPNRYDTITFCSDFGIDDEFVGVVRSVIRSICPDAAIVDLSHRIPRHDVRAGGLLLARSAPYLCPGVVLAVVDPGVGTDRRAIAVEVGDGESVLVGPDNGLLAPVVALVGGATRAVEVDSEAHTLPAAGGTFDGRDVFGPAAAHLAAGVPIGELGPDVDPAALVPGILPVCRDEQGALAAEVFWVDTYGNAQLNVDPDEVDDWGDRIRVEIDGQAHVAHRVRSYADLSPGQIGLVVDSYGLLSLVMDGESAGERLVLAAATAVRLSRFADDETVEPESVAAPVTLSPRRGA